MLHYQYSYAGLSVYLCCTISIPMLHYQYTYAAPLVPDSCTLTGTIIRKFLLTFTGFT